MEQVLKFLNIYNRLKSSKIKYLKNNFLRNYKLSIQLLKKYNCNVEIINFVYLKTYINC